MIEIPEYYIICGFCQKVVAYSTRKFDEEEFVMCDDCLKNEIEADKQISSLGVKSRK